VWQSADKAGTVVGLMKRIHPTTNPGANYNIPARRTPHRCPTAMLGQATTIERRRVEQIDAHLERPLHGSNSRSVIEPSIEITKWRGSKPED
jgi:hypothetical protein